MQPNIMTLQKSLDVPGQTVIRYCRDGYLSLTKSIAESRAGVEARVSMPPGTKRTSGSGAVANVCVGRIDSPKVELWRFMAEEIGLVVTGPRVSAIKIRFIVNWNERRFRASRGPKTSIASKPGNRTKPKRVGTVGCVRVCLHRRSGILLRQPRLGGLRVLSSRV